MAAVVLADNAYGTLNAAIATTDSAITLSAGHGARFPAVISTGSGAAPLYACLVNSGNVLEEIRITVHTSASDVMTIARAAGATTAKAWNAGDRIEARISSSVLSALSRDAISVKDPAFGAAGNGETDDTAAIQAAHDALPASGGGIYFPFGAYLVSSTLAFTKRVHLFGEGNLEDESAIPPCRIIKKSTATGNLLTLSGLSSIVERIVCIGQAGNTGDGIQVKANGIILRDVASLSMGSNGIRIGHSDTTNCNSWTLINVRARKNGGEGVYIQSDDTSSSVNANAGTAINLSCQQNTGKGLRIKNGQKNTFIGLHTESNTGEGIYLEGQADKNVFVGGDQESNGAGVDINVSAATCNDNHFFKVGYNGTFTDSGTRTRNDNDGTLSFPQSTGEVFGNGPTGGSFSGSNECYGMFYGDSNGRLKFGWMAAGPPTTGLVPAQVIADSNTLYLASRDTGAGKVKLLGGSAHAAYLLLDDANGVLETTERLSAAAGVSPGTDAGALQTGRVFMGSGLPNNANGSNGDIYFRTDGGVGTALYQRRSAAWVAVV